MPSPRLPQDMKSFRKLRCNRHIKSHLLRLLRGRMPAISRAFSSQEDSWGAQGASGGAGLQTRCHQAVGQQPLLSPSDPGSPGKEARLLHLLGRTREALPSARHPATASLTSSSPAPWPATPFVGAVAVAGDHTVIRARGRIYSQHLEDLCAFPCFFSGS